MSVVPVVALETSPPLPLLALLGHAHARAPGVATSNTHRVQHSSNTAALSHAGSRCAGAVPCRVVPHRLARSLLPVLCWRQPRRLVLLANC